MIYALLKETSHFWQCLNKFIEIHCTTDYDTYFWFLRTDAHKAGHRESFSIQQVPALRNTPVYSLLCAYYALQQVYSHIIDSDADNWRTSECYSNFYAESTQGLLEGQRAAAKLTPLAGPCIMWLQEKTRYAGHGSKSYYHFKSCKAEICYMSQTHACQIYYNMNKITHSSVNANDAIETSVDNMVKGLNSDN